MNILQMFLKQLWYWTTSNIVEKNVAILSYNSLPNFMISIYKLFFTINIYGQKEAHQIPK